MKANNIGVQWSARRALLPWFLVFSFRLLQAALHWPISRPLSEKGMHPDVLRRRNPNVRATTSCLRRQKSNLSDACRAAFEH